MRTRSVVATTAWCAMLLVLAVGWLVYRPGLAGSYIFDDFANLPSLGSTGPVSNTPALFRYLTAGRADPIGRPLALASFLLDANDWPANAGPFKRTNVLLHLFNGGLLFAVLLRLGGALRWDPRRRAVAALTGASAWVLHPFFVSTTLYIVQREAMLPATFALAALLAYAAARQRSSANHLARSTLWLTLGVGLCTALATLAKANGVLIPLLVLVVHSTLPPIPNSARFNRLCALVLAPPALAVPIWLCWLASEATGAGPIPIRGWSVTQRLLTEPSVLWDYISQLWLIKPISASLLHDDLSAASSWTTPWYTVPAIAAWFLLTLGAVRWRRRAPAAAVGVMFFVAGHLIESTSLPLELYFDHRNYLPALLLFWWPGAWLGKSSSRTVIATTLMATWTALATLTYLNARTWGDPIRQAAQWADTHPRSARAQAYASQVYAAAGELNRARVTIEAAAARFDDEPQIALNLIDIHCRTGGLSAEDMAYARRTFQSAQREPGPLLLNWMTDAARRAHDRVCPGLTRESLEGILASALDNPRIGGVLGRRQDILHLHGTLALLWGEPEQALAWFDMAILAEPTTPAALRQAADLGAAGYPEHGLRHLDYFAARMPIEAHTWRDGMPWVHDLVLARQHYWVFEMAHLRKQLLANVNQWPREQGDQFRARAPHLE